MHANSASTHIHTPQTNAKGKKSLPKIGCSCSNRMRYSYRFVSVSSHHNSTWSVRIIIYTTINVLAILIAWKWCDCRLLLCETIENDCIRLSLIILRHPWWDHFIFLCTLIMRREYNNDVIISSLIFFRLWLMHWIHDKYDNTWITHEK